MAAPAPATPQHEAPSYRLQREQGFRWLNFSPELEVAYRRATKPMTDHQSNVALFCGLVIWLAFIGMDVIRLQDRATDLFSNPRLLTLVQVRITVLMALAGCWLALLQTDPRFKRPWVVAGMLYLLTLGGTISNDTHAALGTPHENNVLILLMVVIFLPLGLRLKEATAVAVLCLVSVLLVSLANHPEGQRESIFYRLFYLLVAACIGGMGAYLREYAQREQFLLRAELEWLARRDALTGLHNRRAFNEHLELALSVGRRDNQPVALMMIDADHFKLYNDAYGHAAGDHALQRLAEVLQSLCRRPFGPCRTHRR